MTDGPTLAPKRRLVHRLPVRLRQHWKLLTTLVAVIAILIAGLGAVRIRPYITGDVTIMTSEITDNISGTVDLFDRSAAHTLDINLVSAEYQDMIDAYTKDGEKKWVTANITIDGTLITDVAVRLKGNSTLMALRGNDFPPPAADDAGGGAPHNNAMNAITASADDPTSLPLLISFEQNAQGRGYQGMTELSVRPGTPVLNEAMALSLTDATGQPTQRYAYVTYTFNDRTTTRLVLEHPDEMYANALFDSDGYLYKADANSRMEFVGTDQSDYADQFTQINATDSGNLQPIISFLQWLDGADDTEFDAQLPDWVDVRSLARYLATQNLLANGDDMGGPGQNYYLWYDLETEKLTVVSWDLNMAMQGDATVGPDDTVSLAGSGGGGGAPGGNPSHADAVNGAPVGGPMKIGNPLKTRCLESATFEVIYADAYWDLFDQMYGDSNAQRLLDTIAATVPVTDGLSQQTLDAAVASMQAWIDTRITSLTGMRNG